MKPQPIWKYTSKPSHLLQWDRLVRILSHPLMFLVADGVIAHGWDWMPIPRKKSYQGKASGKDPSAFPRINLYRMVHSDSRWGWQTAYLMQIDRKRLKDKKQKYWHFAYLYPFETKHKKIIKCRIQIPINEGVKFLVGPYPGRVFAFDEENNELPAKIIGPFHRRDKRYIKYRLL
jgi:hypothetical protein